MLIPSLGGPLSMQGSYIKEHFGHDRELAEEADAAV
jgi:hypothetical protein